LIQFGQTSFIYFYQSAQRKREILNYYNILNFEDEISKGRDRENKSKFIYLFISRLFYKFKYILDSIVKLNFFYTIHVDLSADSVALSHHPRITTLKWALLLCDKIRRKKNKN
jgi:hypothetical protein